MATLIKNTLLKDINPKWIEAFSKENKEPTWLLDVRQKAFETYQKLPWPGPRDEQWKRTDLKALHWDSLQWAPTGKDFFRERLGGLRHVRSEYTRLT